MGIRSIRQLRIYVDTSVIGGCFDPEFSVESKQLIEFARAQEVVLLISDVVLRELENAPEEVRDIILSLPDNSVELISSSIECFQLVKAYLEAGILSSKWINDLTHVALATVSRADAISSWNFKHIVRLDKMKEYNQVNLLNGYGILTIVSPKEVFSNGQE